MASIGNFSAHHLITSSDLEKNRPRKIKKFSEKIDRSGSQSEGEDRTQRPTDFFTEKSTFQGNPSVRRKNFGSEDRSHEVEGKSFGHGGGGQRSVRKIFGKNLNFGILQQTKKQTFLTPN